MTGLGEYRWEGYSLEEKQRWMREGQGAAAVGRGVEVLDALAASSRRSAEGVRGALAELGVDWTGAAADSARVPLATMTGGMGRISEEASTGGAGLDRYAESFAQVSRKIPGPGEVGAQLIAAGDLAVVNGLQSDLRAGPLARRTAELAANAALRAHEQATRDALATFPEPSPAPEPDGSVPPSARAVRPVAPTTTQAADSSEPAGGGEGRRNDNNSTTAPPIAPMPPIPPPINMGDSYRTAPGRYGRLVDPDDAPFGRSAVPDGGAHPGGLLDGRTGNAPPRATHAEIELPRKAPSIPGLAPPGSLDGPDPRGPSRVQGAPLPPPVDRPLPLLSQTPEQRPGAFGRWRGDRAGAVRGSVDEQNFDDNFRELRSDEFPPVHGLGEERGRS